MKSSIFSVKTDKDYFLKPDSHLADAVGLLVLVKAKDWSDLSKRLAFPVNRFDKTSR